MSTRSRRRHDCLGGSCHNLLWEYPLSSQEHIMRARFTRAKLVSHVQGQGSPSHSASHHIQVRGSPSLPDSRVQGQSTPSHSASHIQGQSTPSHSVSDVQGQSTPLHPASHIQGQSSPSLLPTNCPAVAHSHKRGRYVMASPLRKVLMR